MYRVWRDQTLYQISAKSNDLRLSYSDLKNENLEPTDKSRHMLDLTGSEF